MSLNYVECENFSISLEYYNCLKTINNCIVNYIKEYKSATEEYYQKLNILNKNHKLKIKEVIKEIENKNINFYNLYNFIDSIPKIEDVYIENLGFFIEEIEKEIKKYLNIDSAQLIPKIKVQFDNSKKDIIKKGVEIKKMKKKFIDNMTNTEINIYKYFYLKDENNAKKYKQNKQNKHIITEEIINNNISETKNIENKYKYEVEEGENLENNFKKVAVFSCENIKNASNEIFEKLKQLLLNFLISIKNTFKLLQTEIDARLPDLISFDKSTKISEIMEKKLIKNKKNKPHFELEKYNLKVLNNNNDNNINNKNIINEIKTKITEVEDGYNKAIFIEDEIAFLTIKKIQENFELINLKDINIKDEEEKIATNKLTLKLISNMKNENNTNNEQELKITNFNLNEDEIKLIESLLSKHHNRIIFVRLLNKFRSKGRLLIPEQIHNLFLKIFNMILNTFITEKDIFCVKNIMILSQTYFYKDKGKKIYLSQIISNHEIFKDSNFWEYLFNYYMNKEQLKLSNIEMNNAINDDMDEIKLKDKKDNRKLNNMAFGQIMTLSSNMKDFGLSPEESYKIIKPKIEFYKLEKGSVDVIKSVLGYKDKEGENNNKININDEIKEEKNEDSNRDKINELVVKDSNDLINSENDNKNNEINKEYNIINNI